MALSFIHNPSLIKLKGVTIAKLIEEASNKYPEKEALVVPFQNKRITFNELNKITEDVGNGLLVNGLKPRDVIAIFSPSCYEFFILSLAAWKANIVVTFLNPCLKAEELVTALNKVEAKAIFIGENIKDQDYYDILGEVCPEILHKSNSQYAEKIERKVPSLEVLFSVKSGLSGTTSFQEILEPGEKKASPKINSQDGEAFDRICAIFFTSGTTNSPKAVPVSEYGLINNAFLTGIRGRVSPGDRIAVPIPLCHMFGCHMGILLPILFGCTTIIPSFGYHPKGLLEAANLERCSQIVGSPTVFYDIIKTREKMEKLVQLPGLRQIFVGGAILSKAIQASLKNNFPRIVITTVYGMTEAGTVFMGNSEKKGTLGLLLDHIEAKLVDDLGNIVPSGETGELCIRSPFVIQGYLKEGSPKKNGWFHTGDIFRIDPDGNGNPVGRKKDLINRGGVKVSPQEIETILKDHPLIDDAQVFGVPNPRLGEEVAAWIKTKSPNPPYSTQKLEEEIRNFCERRMAGFKIPRFIFFKNNFPKTEMGKIQKHIMQKETIELLAFP